MQEQIDNSNAVENTESPEVDNSPVESSGADQNADKPQELLLGKFKSQDDLIKAYTEMEKMERRNSEELANYKKAIDSISEPEQAVDETPDDIKSAVEMLSKYFPTKEELASAKRVDNYFSDVAPELTDHKDKIKQWAKLPENAGKSIELVADDYKKTFLENLPEQTKPNVLGSPAVEEKDPMEMSREEFQSYMGLRNHGVTGTVTNMQGSLRKR